MSEIITFPLPAGPNFTIPDVGDENWGQSVTDYLVALPNGVPPTSGTFSLTGDLGFGPTFGLLSQYFKTLASNPATAGLLRLSNTDSIAWRNTAHGGNLLLGINGSDQLTFNGSVLTSGGITALTGDGTATGPGSAALTLATVNSNVGSFTNAHITVNGKGLITAASSGTTGNLTDAGTDGITVTGGTGAVLGSGTSISQHVADATHNGYLSSTDWSTFNSAAGGGITSLTGDVTGTGPGATATTLATVNSNVGSFTLSSITVNAKGLITAASTNNNPSVASLTTTAALGIIFNNSGSLLSVIGSVATNSTYTIPDVGTSANFVMTAGTQTIGGNKTISGTTNLSGLTASTALALDSSKNIVSVTNTGSGNNVLATSPTISGSLNLSSLTATTALALDGSKNVVSSATTTNAAGYIIGTIVQMVTANTTTPTSVTSNTFSAAGPSVSITPHATTHKIRVTLTGDFENGSLLAINAYLTIKRGSTDLAVGSNGLVGIDNDSAATGSLAVPVGISIYDSPATTSSTTYQAFIRNTNNSTTVQFPSSCNAVITAEEIAF